MLEQTLNWLNSIEPFWVSLVIVISGLFVIAVAVSYTLYEIMSTKIGNYLVLGAMASLVAYSWYVALFQQ